MFQLFHKSAKSRSSYKPYHDIGQITSLTPSSRQQVVCANQVPRLTLSQQSAENSGMQSDFE